MNKEQIIAVDKWIAHQNGERKWNSRKALIILGPEKSGKSTLAKAAASFIGKETVFLSATTIIDDLSLIMGKTVIYDVSSRLNRPTKRYLVTLLTDGNVEDGGQSVNLDSDFNLIITARYPFFREDSLPRATIVELERIAEDHDYSVQGALNSVKRAIAQYRPISK